MKFRMIKFTILIYHFNDLHGITRATHDTLKLVAQKIVTQDKKIENVRFK